MSATVLGRLRISAVLHSVEGAIERAIVRGADISESDLALVHADTGAPCAWLPLIEGYTSWPQDEEGGEGVALPETVLDGLQRRVLGAEDLGHLRSRLRDAFASGPGRAVEAEEESAGEDEEDDENREEVDTTTSRIPIPPESFLEELATAVQIHPLSAYLVLREGIRNEGIRCDREELRLLLERVSILVMRLVGHRWPAEASDDARPDWVDRDGIIPVTEGGKEPPLVERVREALVEDFGAEQGRAFAREWETLVGKSLGEWLAVDFFKRHTSLFKKRPIAWQIESASGGDGKRRAARKAPAFSCLVYYHRLDADLLPKLRTQYVGPLRTSLGTELGSLEKVKSRSADQVTRRLELEEKI